MTHFNNEKKFTGFPRYYLAPMLMKQFKNGIQYGSQSLKIMLPCDKGKRLFGMVGGTNRTETGWMTSGNSFRKLLYIKFIELLVLETSGIL